MKKQPLHCVRTTIEIGCITIENHRDDFTENNESLLTIMDWGEAQARLFSSFIESLRQPSFDVKLSDDHPYFSH